MCATTDCSRTNIRIENNIKFSGRVSRWHTASHWFVLFSIRFFPPPIDFSGKSFFGVYKKKKGWGYCVF